jgi:hypothetical protein
MFDVRRTTDEAPWFAFRRSGRQTYPISWQGWLLTLAYALFVPVMVGVAVDFGSPAVTMAVLVIIAVVTIVYLAVIAHRTRGSNSDA